MVSYNELKSIGLSLFESPHSVFIDGGKIFVCSSQIYPLSGDLMMCCEFSFPLDVVGLMLLIMVVNVIIVSVGWFWLIR